MLTIQVVACVGQLRLLGALRRARLTPASKSAASARLGLGEMLRGTKLALTTTKALSGQAGLRFIKLAGPALNDLVAILMGLLFVLW